MSRNENSHAAYSEGCYGPNHHRSGPTSLGFAEEGKYAAVSGGVILFKNRIEKEVRDYASEWNMRLRKNRPRAEIHWIPDESELRNLT